MEDGVRLDEISYLKNKLKESGKATRKQHRKVKVLKQRQKSLRVKFKKTRHKLQTIINAYEDRCLKLEKEILELKYGHKNNERKAD